MPSAPQDEAEDFVTQYMRDYYEKRKKRAGEVLAFLENGFVPAEKAKAAAYEHFEPVPITDPEIRRLMNECLEAKTAEAKDDAKYFETLLQETRGAMAGKITDEWEIAFREWEDCSDRGDLEGSDKANKRMSEIYDKRNAKAEERLARSEKMYAAQDRLRLLALGNPEARTALEEIERADCKAKRAQDLIILPAFAMHYLQADAETKQEIHELAIKWTKIAVTGNPSIGEQEEAMRPREWEIERSRLGDAVTAYEEMSGVALSVEERVHVMDRVREKEQAEFFRFIRRKRALLRQ